jgi:protein ImuB
MAARSSASQLSGQAEWNLMLFASIFVPDFSLQALFAKRPELQTEAIALVEGTPPIVKVVAVNHKAFKLGAETGLMKAQAEAVGVRIIQRSVELEDAAHVVVLTCARSFSPQVQDKAVNLIVLDIDGLKNLFGSPEQIAIKVRSALGHERLTVNVAVAGNPDSAMIAARGYPGITVISETTQIGGLPLTLLDLSPAQLETLNLWGITTLGALAALDAKALSQRLGQQGVQLQKLARGQQVHPFVADEEQIEFRERSELEHSIDLLDSLSFVLASLLERICIKLEEHSLATNEVDYELALDPPRVVGKETPSEQLFHRRSIKLPNPTTDCMLLLRLMQLDLQAHPPTAAVLKVSLRSHAVRPRYIQQGLFAPQTPDPGKLELLAARLANLVGNGEVGSLELLDTHRPRAFVMARFEPETDISTPIRLRTSSSKVALRLFDPARRANIRIRSDVPLHVSFDGKSGDVIEHSAPWLASGDWWNELAYDRKEWDVEVRFADGTKAKYRISLNLFTNQPLIDGSYD